MKQVGVKKQYAYSQDSVVSKPEILVSNAGEVCTEEMVDEAITALTTLGYGIKKTPSEMSAEHVRYSLFLASVKLVK